MAGELFKKYYRRIAKEGFLKSILSGLVVGFLAMLLTAGLFWYMGWKAVWICGIVGCALTALATYLFYRFKFQPTTKAIAKRIDELGLEERILTMTELEGDESYIAMKQREDALKALGTVHAGLIKIVVSAPLVIATVMSGIYYKFRTSSQEQHHYN